MLCWQLQKPVRVQVPALLPGQDAIDNACRLDTSTYFIAYFHPIFIFPRLPRTFIKLHMLPAPRRCILALRGVDSCNAWNFLPVVISRKTTSDWDKSREALGLSWDTYTHTHTRLAGRARSERLLSSTYLQTAVIQICALGLAQHTTTGLLDTLVWTGGWSGRGQKDSVWMFCATKETWMEGRRERGLQS